MSTDRPHSKVGSACTRTSPLPSIGHAVLGRWLQIQHHSSLRYTSREVQSFYHPFSSRMSTSSSASPISPAAVPSSMVGAQHTIQRKISSCSHQTTMNTTYYAEKQRPKRRIHHGRPHYNSVGHYNLCGEASLLQHCCSNIMNTTCTETATHSTMRRRRRRMRSCSANNGMLAAAALFLSLTSSNQKFVSATKNFCGVDWGDASSGCENNQPCPLGTNEECTLGTCWGDTTCDTSLGHGILWDLEHPTHSRFCGKTWNDANDNCSLKRHCPSGDSDECPKDEDCYSFLSDCNYVNMIGGPVAANSNVGGGGGGGGGDDRLPQSDPSRSNYCGWDWNDALTNCDDDDHWCPSGANEECPGGKQCFGGTECKYVADLFPTESPTDEPTESPTPSPTDYNLIENTRFCGTGWEDAMTTCRIGSHCPSGNNADCPGEQVCVSWIIGCNIIDFTSHFLETGQQIFGVEHWLLPEDAFEGENVEDVKSEEWEPQLPPAEILQSIPTPAQTPPGTTSPPTPTRPPTQRPTTGTPTKFDPDRYLPENHIFCGSTWTDASERCSPETFCSGGATQQCDNESDFCWVGVNACNAGEWRTQQWIDGGGGDTEVPTEPPVTPFPTTPPRPPPPTATPITNEVTTATPTINDPNRYISGNHIFCGASWTDASERCSPETFCSNGATHQCADAGDFCWVGVSACDAGDWTQSPTEEPTRIITEVPTRSPVTPFPTTREPTPRPISATTSSSQTEAVEEEEDEMTTTVIRQSYCATDYAELLSTCATLSTCNRYKPCPDRYSCFSNVKCTVTTPKATPKPVSSPVTGAPISNAPISNAPISNAPISNAPITNRPTQHPTIFTLSEEEVAQRLTNMNNYCASSLTQVYSSCSHSLYTCNAGDGMCGPGTFCFENIVCPDSVAVTRAPVTASPTTPPPTTMKPTHESIASSSMGKLNFGDSKSEEEGANSNIAAMAQNYCAKSKDLMESTCSTTAPNCNDDDGPCPSGMFCFGNHVCESALAVKLPAVTPPPTPKPTPKPTPPPTLQPTPKPTAASINSPIGDGNNNGILQNYCSVSEAALESTCATAKTCNDGDGPCPSGSFCFGNQLCPNQSSAKKTPIASPVTPKPTMNPTVKPTSKPIPIALNKPGSSGNNSAKQNYCAQSSEQLSTTCAWAPTCNDGDGPCPEDTFCFPNAVCESVNQAAPEMSPKEDQNQPPAATPTPEQSKNHDSSATITDLACIDLCLQAIDFSDCNYVLSIDVDFLPCTGSTTVSDFCTANGQCGTDLSLNNCPNDQDMYIRLEPSKCVEHGLVGGSGVIPSLRTEGAAVANNGAEGGDTSDLPNETAREATNSSSISENLGNISYPWEWEEGSAPDDNSENGALHYDKGDRDNHDFTGGWWKQEIDSAGGIIDGWKMYLISSFLGLIAFPMLYGI